MNLNIDINNLVLNLAHCLRPAAAILEELRIQAAARIMPEYLSPGIISKSTGLPLETIAGIISTMEHFGLISVTAKGYKLLALPETYAIAKSACEGAATINEIEYDPVRLTVTFPEAPSRLIEMLRLAGGHWARFAQTTNVFEEIALTAKKSFSIITPFIDEAGAEWIIKLFDRTMSGVEKFLITRVNAKTEHTFNSLNKRLKALSANIYDYQIKHGDERSIPIETFHAKIVVSESRCYIGSANLLKSSMDIALEAGCFLKDTRAVNDVNYLVDAIIASATKV